MNEWIKIEMFIHLLKLQKYVLHGFGIKRDDSHSEGHGFKLSMSTVREYGTVHRTL